MASRLAKTTALLLTASVLCGCTSPKVWWRNGLKVGPNYRKPAVPVAEDWVESGDTRIVAGRQRDDWWRVFGDEGLDQLVQTAYQQNLTLRSAAIQVLTARRQRAIAAGNLLPQQQTFDTQFQRNQVSTTLATSSPLIPRAFDTWFTGFNLTWEIDLWGRIRRSIESADAATDAAIEGYDAVLVTLVSDVASAYLQIRSIDERIQLAQRNAALQQASLEITEKQLDAGRVSGLDVQQAVVNVTTTRATIPGLRQQRQQVINQLAVLLGTTPHALEPLLREPGNLPETPSEAIVGIPAELLRRRPDIRQAERAIAAQSAQIGITEAALYPTFALSGQIALTSEEFSDLFRTASTAGTIAPGFSWNILNYGRILNAVKVEELLFQQTVLDYENAVLVAHSEVEDAIAQYLRSQETAAELRKTVEALAEAVRLVQIQYKEGETDFGRVFVLEGNLATAQDNLVVAETNAALGLVDVYRALGGGWQIRCNTPYRGRYPLESIPGGIRPLPPIGDPAEEAEPVPTPELADPLQEPISATTGNARSLG